MLNAIRKKINNQTRIGIEEGLYLLESASIYDLGNLANLVRNRINPNKTVTYVIDTNLNYTNICDAYCSFCAFYRTDPKDPSAYTYTVEEMMKKIGVAKEKGCTTVLMQGGLNNAIPFEYYKNMVSETVRLYPDVTPHYYSAPEIIKMSEVSKKSVKQVLIELKQSGQRTIPGGGSEILSNSIKSQISRFKPKNTVDQWTKVHSSAHEIGFMTTATMMYGHIEKPQHVIETLSHIRTVQDESEKKLGSFTAFIPWSYKKEHNALSKKVSIEAGPNQYLRIIALSRIFLDNIPHIQASWFSEGYSTGQMALHFGADDFGGTLFDENVMLAAGFYNRTSIDGIRSLINEAGFDDSQRTTEYTIVGDKIEVV